MFAILGCKSFGLWINFQAIVNCGFWLGSYKRLHSKEPNHQASSEPFEFVGVQLKNNQRTSEIDDLV